MGLGQTERCEQQHDRDRKQRGAVHGNESPFPGSAPSRQIFEQDRRWNPGKKNTSGSAMLGCPIDTADSAMTGGPLYTADWPRTTGIVAPGHQPGRGRAGIVWGSTRSGGRSVGRAGRGVAGRRGVAVVATRCGRIGRHGPSFGRGRADLGSSTWAWRGGPGSSTWAWRGVAVWGSTTVWAGGRSGGARRGVPTGPGGAGIGSGATGRLCSPWSTISIDSSGPPTYRCASRSWCLDPGFPPVGVHPPAVRPRPSPLNSRPVR